MNFSRKLQLWLADRYPTFDRQTLYRRMPVADGPKVSGWDAVLIGFVSLILVLFGMFGVIAGILILAAIIMAIFGW